MIRHVILKQHNILLVRVCCYKSTFCIFGVVLRNVSGINDIKWHFSLCTVMMNIYTGQPCSISVWVSAADLGRKWNCILAQCNLVNVKNKKKSHCQLIRIQTLLKRLDFLVQQRSQFIKLLIVCTMLYTSHLEFPLMLSFYNKILKFLQNVFELISWSIKTSLILNPISILHHMWYTKF